MENQVPATPDKSSKRTHAEDITRLAVIMRDSRDAIIIESDGVITAWNRGAEQLYGWSEDEAIGMKFENLTPPENRQQCAELRNNLITGTLSESIETARLTKNGAIIQVWVTATKVTEGSSDNIVSIGHSGCDIVLIERNLSDRKLAEKALQEIEWLLTTDLHQQPKLSSTYGDLTILNTDRTILDTVGTNLLDNLVAHYLSLLETSSAIYEKNGDYAYGIFSSGYCRYLDTASRKLCGTADNQIALASGCWLCHGSCWDEASRQSIKTGQSVDIECCGGIRLRAEPIFANGEAVGSINLGYGNPPQDPVKLAQIANLLKLDPEELSRQAMSYRTRPPYLIKLALRQLKIVAQIIGLMVERKKAIVDLEMSENQFRALFDESHDAIAVTSVSDQKLNRVNPAFRVMFGLAPDENIENIGPMDFWPEIQSDGRNSIEMLQGMFEKTLDEGVSFFESTHQNKNGELFETTTLLSKIRFGEEIFIMGTIRDISDQKRAERERLNLEAQLRQAQKMETVGRLAGGIAHDFNNLLCAIMGNLEIVLPEIPAGDNRDCLEEVQTCAERCATLTNQLLAFARKQVIKPQVLDPNKTISDSLKMFQRLIGENIKLVWAPGSQIWPICMDPSQIDQLLANLCVNARDAIADTGVLTIETTNHTLDAEYCWHHSEASPGQYICITISDTGCGMDSATLIQIFEPFFTTKEIGKGTGLGLATVYGIVKQNKGMIEVQSELGYGTTFRLYLPRYIGATNNTDSNSEVKPAPKGTETILIVEDEEAVLNVMTKGLAGLGYNILTATTPGQALDLAANHTNKIQLLVIDVILPEMNGRDLAKQLLIQQPKLKVLYMSGYTADIIAPHGVLERGMRFLQKPFTLTDLAVMIRALLTEPD